MPQRPLALVADSYYHVYNRGVGRQPIFYHADHWAFFVRRLKEHFLPTVADIVAYCLMPNHYHLLVHLETDEFSKRVMQPFGTSYAKAVNAQLGRVGPLFQGRFHALRVHDDRYLIGLSAYIHLNPADAGLVERAEDWVYSSYRDYIGLRAGTLPHPEIVLDQFPSRQAYREYVETYHLRDDDPINSLLLD